MRFSLLILLTLLCMLSCRCNMLKTKNGSKTDDEPDSPKSETIYHKKGQAISAEGLVPCHITDQKKIRCETVYATLKYDAADLAEMNHDDYVAIAANERYILCGVTTYGHLNCIGKSVKEKRQAKKLADLFQSFNLDSFYLSYYDTFACGHDVDTDLMHCLQLPEGQKCNNGKAIEFHEKVKDFAIETSRVYIINPRDEMEYIDLCTDERARLLPDSPLKFERLYFTQVFGDSGFRALVCGLSDGHAKCAEPHGVTEFNAELAELEAKRWKTLSLGNEFLCGVLAENDQGHCIARKVKPDHYDINFKLTTEELIDIKVGIYSVVWQTKAGTFSGRPYLTYIGGS